MSVGFVMLAHEALDRAALVARRLASFDCPVAIHVDARVGAEFDDLKAELSGEPNVSFRPRIACEWGSWALVQASRGAAESLLEAHPELTHIYLMSGTCLPIKPIPALLAHLANHPDTDFIESVTIEDVPWTKGGLSEERFTLTFPFSWRKQRRLFDAWVAIQRQFGLKRSLLPGLSPHLGSQWWCLTRQTLECIFNDPKRDQVDQFFQNVWIPDESYYQSLVRQHGQKVESRSLTLSKFDHLGKPHVFYDDHLALLQQSEAFFARKIWHSADRLYDTFLGKISGSNSTAQMPATYIERKFVDAADRSVSGRQGLVMASRFPKDLPDSPLTAAPYAVFHGFSDVFEDFPQWVEKNTNSQAHGHLFARGGAEFVDGSDTYAGALSASADLRDYNPGQFVRNLVWNTRGAHQSFLFAAYDSQKVCEFLAADRNAYISVISGAWAVPLLHKQGKVQDIRAIAALYQQNEASFLDHLKKNNAMRRVHIWSLAEFLERPMEPLQKIVDQLCGVGAYLLAEAPQLRDMAGLPEFLQTLRNTGMNPHLAGDISKPPANQAPAKLHKGIN